jgi:hypothetical protein
MDLTSRQRIGAVVLIISGAAAFAAPFLLHSPPTQGSTIPGPDNDNNGNNDNNGGNSETTTPPGGGRSRKSLQDLKEMILRCDTEHNGPRRSLEAKVDSAMRAEHSTRTDHHIAVFLHQLDTPAAEKHAGECIDSLKSLIDEL